MKNIKDILEGLMTNDINNLEAPEPIEIKEMDTSCFAVIRALIEEVNHQINEVYVSKHLRDIADSLKEIGLQRINDLEKTSRGRKDIRFWSTMRELYEELEDFKSEPDAEVLENYRYWKGFERLVEDLFRDTQIKKHLLTGFFAKQRELTEMFWTSDGKGEIPEDIVKRLERKLPKDSFEIKEFGQGYQRLSFSAELLVNYK